MAKRTEMPPQETTRDLLKSIPAFSNSAMNTYKRVVSNRLSIS